MNILIVTGIFPPDIGGPATYVPGIARALQEKGHKITVITTSEPGRFDLEDSRHPFSLYRMNRKANLVLRTFRFIKTISHHAKMNDAVLANGLFLEATVASRLAGKPMVHKVVGDWAWERSTIKGWVTENFEEFQNKYHGIRVEALKTLRRWWTRRADKVIVPCRYLVNPVTSWGIPKEKIAVIHNAVEPSSGTQAVQVPLGTSVKLVTAGRLIPLKRIDKILEVLAPLRTVGLVVIGDGPEREHLERLSEILHVSDRVYFAGHRNKAETITLMAACDVFVLNSTHEAFPHVLLEAISLGLPVIATAVGGTPELVRNGETGLLIKVGDVKALRSAIGQLIGSPETLHEMKTKAKLDARNFSFSRMVRETEHVLQTLSRRS